MTDKPMRVEINAEGISMYIDGKRRGKYADEETLAAHFVDLLAEHDQLIEAARAVVDWDCMDTESRETGIRRIRAVLDKNRQNPLSDKQNTPLQ